MRADVTMLLQSIGDDEDATDRLFALVYDDLHAMARKHLRGERPGHTLQATALISEAYVRLVGGATVSFNDRVHFFRTATEAMRRILIDHARARLAQKRGGGAQGRGLFEGDGAVTLDPARLIEIDEALGVLRREDERAASLVRYRFYGGMTLDQAAELLGVSTRTAIRDWEWARARLTQLLDNA